MRGGGDRLANRVGAVEAGEREAEKEQRERERERERGGKRQANTMHHSLLLFSGIVVGCLLLLGGADAQLVCPDAPEYVH